ncbi:hypothetical protein MTS1_01763 [Microbacterium sp. TS-1]|nr:hypothetical protein MTS1_01763 [Microbacterium sp. TS-1]
MLQGSDVGVDRASRPPKRAVDGDAMGSEAESLTMRVSSLRKRQRSATRWAGATSNELCGSYIEKPKASVCELGEEVRDV